jgi:hypothetical protein
MVGFRCGDAEAPSLEPNRDLISTIRPRTVEFAGKSDASVPNLPGKLGSRLETATHPRLPSRVAAS